MFGERDLRCGIGGTWYVLDSTISVRGSSWWEGDRQWISIEC